MTPAVREALRRAGRAILEGRDPDPAGIPAVLLNGGGWDLTPTGRAYALVAVADWHYNMSDDLRAYERGRLEVERALALCRSLGLNARHILQEIHR
jgi:hypothetical protein